MLAAGIRSLSMTVPMAHIGHTAVSVDTYGRPPITSVSDIAEGQSQAPSLKSTFPHQNMSFEKPKARNFIRTQ